MKKRAEGLIRAAVEAYCLLLFVLLPLYMRHGFTLIGDVKYQLFRNVTILFCIMLSILQFIWCVNGGGRKKTAGIVSRTDILMLGYLVSSLLSFVFSMDRYIALWGLHGWYMGFLSQLMFVWIYFVLSRWCGMAESVRKAMLSCFVCAGIVMVLAVLNRYAFDPLGMMEGMDQGTWEADHRESKLVLRLCQCGSSGLLLLRLCRWEKYEGSGTGGLSDHFPDNIDPGQRGRLSDSSGNDGGAFRGCVGQQKMPPEILSDSAVLSGGGSAGCTGNPAEGTGAGGGWFLKNGFALEGLGRAAPFAGGSLSDIVPQGETGKKGSSGRRKNP